tara:strand:- start:266 stop:853 length:588 start_codon:yes stop_codon:yes gene_type:complete
MKLLREYIRNILSEGAKGVLDLVEDDIYVTLEIDGFGFGVTLTDSEARQSRSNANGEVLVYSPSAPMDNYGSCDNAFMVGSSEADGGWGPFIYDIAIEYSTLNGGGLMPDRDMVSSDARRIWDYYLNSRGDVQAHQLDDLENKLTPTDKDNCHQASAIKDKGPEFIESSLSKRYTKAPTIINALRKAGRLIEKEA